MAGLKKEFPFFTSYPGGKNGDMAAEPNIRTSTDPNGDPTNSGYPSTATSELSTESNVETFRTAPRNTAGVFPAGDESGHGGYGE